MLVDEKSKALCQIQKQKNAHSIKSDNTLIEAIKKLRENFCAEIQHNMYGGQKKVWRMLRNRKKPVNEEIQIRHAQSNESTHEMPVKVDMENNIATLQGFNQTTT